MNLSDRSLLKAAAQRLAEITKPVSSEGWFDTDVYSLAWALEDRYVGMTRENKAAWEHAKFIAHMGPEVATVLGVWLNAVADSADDAPQYFGTAITLATYIMETGYDAWDDWAEQYTKSKP